MGSRTFAAVEPRRGPVGASGVLAPGPPWAGFGPKLSALSARRRPELRTRARHCLLYTSPSPRD
eukprot:1756542-Alexandrium_andersonii.AAC.1